MGALIALAALGIPQIARAQEQPRPAQSAVELDAKVALPAKFSAPQFFDALAKATNVRFVAPVPGGEQLAQLNQKMGGKTLTFPEIVPLYEQTLGYRFSSSQSDGYVVKVRLPDEMIYPTFSIRENKADFLRLLVELSPDQINRMYLQGGLTVKDLTPAQTQMYLELRRKNARGVFYRLGDKTLTDAEMLAQPVRLSFSFEAVALFINDEALPALPLFDYGTGLIWNPLVSTDTEAFAKTAYERDKAKHTPIGQTNTSSISSDKARATMLEYPQTSVTTVGAALKQIEDGLDQTVVFDSSLVARQVRATPIIISAGRYRADQLFEGVGESVGAKSVFYDDVPTLEKRAPQQQISQLPPLVEAAQGKLQRLSLRSAGLPFLPSRFERPQTFYSELFGSELIYLRAKLLNENTKGYDQIDLSKHTYRFANQLYFTSRSGDINTPFITSSVQIW